jgi:hypothetical protein
LGEGGQYVNRQQCVNHTNKKQLLLITLRNLILNEKLKVHIITKCKHLHFIYFNKQVYVLFLRYNKNLRIAGDLRIDLPHPIPDGIGW